MGKARRHKARGRTGPTGLPSVRGSDDTAEMELRPADTTSATLTNLLENLQSVNPEERECGCAILANFVNERGGIQQLLASKSIKIIGPLMIDVNLTTRQHAVGALRNMSVDGGCEACIEMVKQDVMTPLLTQMQQCWQSMQEQDESNKIDIRISDIFMQSLHLLWNLCENSEIAVKIVTQQKITPVLFDCLCGNLCTTETKVVVGQCLYTVTDNNQELISQISGQEVDNQLYTLISDTSEATEYILLRVLAAGILYNLKTNFLIHSHGEFLNNIMQVLASTLDQDASGQMDKYASAIHEKKTSDDAVNKVDSSQEPEDKASKEKMIEIDLKNLKQILSAQSLAVELLANFCCPDDDPGDWEDTEESSDECSSLDGPVDESAAAGDLPSLCVPTEIHSAFVSNEIVIKVLAKVFPQGSGLTDRLKLSKDGHNLIKMVQSLQCRSLLCISNMVNAMETSSLGGVDQLHNVWSELSQYLSSQSVLKEEEYLDAVTTAMRSISQKMVDSGSNKFTTVTSQDLEFLFKIGHECSMPNVRTNAIRIVSTIGCFLAKDLHPHPLLKDIGLYFLQCCSTDSKLWVIAEALDSIFDVFAEDHLDPVIKEISMVEKLKMLVSPLKHKIREQRKELGEHLPIISTSRNNLVRFIKYKQTH